VQEREGGVREGGGEGGRRLRLCRCRCTLAQPHTSERKRDSERERERRRASERERESEREIPHIVDEGRGQMINIMKFECRTFARLHIHYLPAP
jgi:hypothetical protein